MGTAAQEAIRNKTYFAKWSDEFSVGIGEIDSDHEKLFELLTKLHGASNAGTRREELGKILDEVLHYVCYHFAHEEELLLQTNFPGYKKHRRQHQAMTGMIEEICADFRSGAPEPLPERVLEFLKNWLYDHVLRADRSYAAYVKANRAPH